MDIYFGSGYAKKIKLDANKMQLSSGLLQDIATHLY